MITARATTPAATPPATAPIGTPLPLRSSLGVADEAVGPSVIVTGLANNDEATEGDSEIVVGVAVAKAPMPLKISVGVG